MYMITNREGDQLCLKKFVNNQLRNREYIVHTSDTFCIPTDISLKPSPKQSDDSHEDTCCPALPLPPDNNGSTPQINIHPPAVPVMDIPVPEPAPGPAEPTDAPIAPEPDSWDDPDPESGNSSSDNDIVTEPARPPSPPVPRRSMRNRVPNSRLKDYVWLIAD